MIHHVMDDEGRLCYRTYQCDYCQRVFDSPIVTDENGERMASCLKCGKASPSGGPAFRNVDGEKLYGHSA